jgi:hypothetical protein
VKSEERQQRREVELCREERRKKIEDRRQKI